jgi:hypothetical protein
MRHSLSRHFALALALTAAFSGCDSKKPPGAGDTTAALPLSIPLATLCEAYAGTLRARGESAFSQDELQRIENNARQYALKEVAAKGLPQAEVERQVSALAKLASTKLTPGDSGDESVRKAQAEAKALSAQVKEQCVPAFSRAS